MDPDTNEEQLHTDDLPENEPDNNEMSDNFDDESQEDDSIEEGRELEDDEAKDESEDSSPAEKQKRSQNDPREKLKKEGKKKILTWLGPYLIGIVIVVVLLAVIAFAILAIFYKDEANADELFTPSKICLDPGHPSEVGSGAPGEIERNWLVVQELKTALEKKGYEVVLTKSSESESVTNKDRADRCASAGANFMYRIHGNDAGGKKGPFHMYPDPTLKNIYDTSKKYTDIIHKAVTDELGITGRTSGAQPLDGGTHSDSDIKGAPLAGSLEANVKSLPCSLIEMVALNTEGKAWLDNPSNRAKLISGMVKGIEAALPPGGSGALAIKEQAQYYLAHLGEYRNDAIRDYTDCGGFVLTIFDKRKLDPEFVKWAPGNQAKDFINYFKDHPEKYTIVSENVNSTKILKPGDILLNAKYGSHAAVYVGTSGSNKIQASLGSHGPEAGNWYDELHVAVRMK